MFKKIEGSKGFERRRDGRVRFLALGIFIAVFSFTFLMQMFKGGRAEVEAASLANFDPGYIISDWQMGNYNSMSEAEIQAWLTSKNSCANTNYNYYLGLSANKNYTWHFENGHFICLSEERFGDNDNEIGFQYSESAAHIIWQAAQDYRINPQVLLVLLQKETGLITDPIPNNGDYRKATGYGCPDTAACSSKYYGFKNQIRNAAALFRTVLDGGWTNYPLGENYIQYNPNASCGGSVVNIRSLATSALYRYTPYQPNEGALAAGYGTAYCGAYGNRNFYLYFEDWWGGVTDSKINWIEMTSPRTMKVNKETMFVDAYSHDVTGEWLEAGGVYYFTKKLELFWGDGQQVCLRRKEDEGTNKCVLMTRLTDISLEDEINELEAARNYEIQKWTCGVSLKTLLADCEKAYTEGDKLSIVGILEVNGNKYLVEDGEKEYAVFALRAKQLFDYVAMKPTLMELTEDSYKMVVESGEKIQELKKGAFIRIAEKIEIDGVGYYRTAHDAKNKNDYVIPASSLSEDIFRDFMSPRNLEVAKNVNLVDLGTGNKCGEYKKGEIKKYTQKAVLNDGIYFQDESNDGTQCVVEASNLKETEYNFSEGGIADKFKNFMRPRNLKTKKDIFMINATDGTTCKESISAGNVRKYDMKVEIGGFVFFRDEDGTKSDSMCVVPANILEEL